MNEDELLYLLKHGRADDKSRTAEKQLEEGARGRENLCAL